MGAFLKRKLLLRQGNSQGFTIVELLIVVVVIAILAAITLVAFNGITNKAKASAAQSAAEQAAKKVALYALDNGDTYPDTLATAGITNTGSATLQYSVNNAASPKTYCITASVSDISYFVSSTQQNPQSGGCAGHGQNGVAAVTNVATNPSFETAGPNVEVRRNMYTNPVNGGTQTAGLAQGLSSYVSGAGTAAPTFAVSAGWQQVTATNLGTTAPARAGYRITVPLGQTVTAGTPIGVSVTIAQGTLPAGIQGKFYIDAYDGSNNFRGNLNQAFTPNAAATTRLSATITPTGDTTYLSWYIWLEPTNAAVGWSGTATIGAAWSTVEVGRSAGTGFSGSGLSVPDSDLTASWTGAAYASPSILSGKSVVGVVNGTGVVAIQSDKWSKFGSKSVRIIPTASSGSSYAILSLGANTGTRGTFLLTMHRDVAQPDRSVFNGVAYWNPVPQPQSSKWLGAGDNSIRVYSDPTGTSSNVIVRHDGFVGDPDLYIDGFFQAQGNYTGQYHDGSSDASWIWNGAADVSTSTGPGN